MDPHQSTHSTHPPTHQQHIHHQPPPDDLPPSYEDATHSSTTPLLVGPPPHYGTYVPYGDDVSPASSVIEETSRSLPEWVGQALVVICFLGMLYGFYRLVSDPDMLPG